MADNVKEIVVTAQPRRGHALANAERQKAGALQDAIASQGANELPPGFGLRPPSGALGIAEVSFEVQTSARDGRRYEKSSAQQSLATCQFFRSPPSCFRLILVRCGWRERAGYSRGGLTGMLRSVRRAGA